EDRHEDREEEGQEDVEEDVQEEAQEDGGTEAVRSRPQADQPCTKHVRSRTLPEAKPMSRILVVEDDRATRHLLGEVLKNAGHTVVAAKDGAGALKEVAGSAF